METPELVLLTQKLSEATREYITEEVEAISARFCGIIAQIPVGPKGDLGPRGEKGLDGEIGFTGDMGPVGERGERGERGEPGPRGENGDNGPAVDMDQVRSIIQSEVAKTILLMPIPKDGAPGEKGDPGKSIEGPPGPAGKPGKDAESIHPDTVRLMIFEEVNKAVGSMVKPKDGEPGRDALQLEIQPAIDLMRSVPRGTFAKHAGGLWRAIRNTTPNAAIEDSGWENIVDGVSQLEVAQADNEREFIVIAKLASGVYSKQTFVLPVLIFRGIYEDGHLYQRGDTVTYGGSSWHCQKDGVSTRPGSSNSDWCLMVKEGRKGLDASSSRTCCSTESVAEMIDLVTLGEAKIHLRLDLSASDSDMDVYFKIGQASEIVMEYLKLTAPPDSWIVAGSSPIVYKAPAMTKAAVLLVISELYENREASVIEILTDTVKALLDRMPSLA